MCRNQFLRAASRRNSERRELWRPLESSTEPHAVCPLCPSVPPVHTGTGLPPKSYPVMTVVLTVAKAIAPALSSSVSGGSCYSFTALNPPFDRS